jgi:alanine-glyoxylate transaminase/serine-glyoxylate transaminase/serine-pyruvate transaminase
MDTYPQQSMSQRILLGPGPSMVHPRVLHAMAAPMVGHLDPLFLQIMDRIQQMLRSVFQTENELTIPISGTGSAAMEAAFANLIEPDDAVLICINGYFGHRMVDMAQRYGAKVASISRPWGEVFDLEQIEAAVKEENPKLLGIVHAETSTGAQQPLDGLAGIAQQHGAMLVVDAVTSLGGLPVGVDENGIDVCFSGTQKCLSVPPGLGPISLNDRAAEVIAHRSKPVANWYLDLSMVQSYWGDERTYHHTAPISANFGLYEGLRLIAEEGLQERWERHRKNAEMLWAGLEQLGLTLHVPLEHRLAALTTVRVPEGVDEFAVRKRLLEQFNIEIAGGLGQLAGKVWRIGLMGHSSTEENVLLLLAALKRVLD